MDTLVYTCGEVEVILENITDGKFPHSPFRRWFELHEIVWGTEINEEMNRNRSKCHLCWAQLLNEDGKTGYHAIGQGLRLGPGNKELQDLDDDVRKRANRNELSNLYEPRLDPHC